ncbi:hypothetical protein ACTHO0_23040 [Cytobacillus praedii]|uniref:hypothetical protein n=1 Tax=Cytobacillus praedii TaxID=1742358 RepID=UPI003F7E77C1
MSVIATDVVCTWEPGEEPKETYRKVFDAIGNHIKNNSERFAEQIVDVHRGMKIEINIPVKDLVSFTVKFDEYIFKSEEK